MELSESARKRIVVQLEYLIKNKEHLVIDTDTHVTDTKNMAAVLKRKLLATHDYYHGKPVSAEELLAEMTMADIDMSLIWQNPAATVYSDTKKSNYYALLNANQYVYEASIQYPQKFIPAGWTDPKALGIDLAIQLVEKCILGFGFAIVKMNPAQNGYPIDSEQVIPVFEKIIELKAIPAFHFGSDTEFTSAEGLARLASQYPDNPIIAVHMGGGGASYTDAEDQYIKARKIGLMHPNIRYVLSTKRDTHIESDLITYTLAGSPFNRNIFCASDAPYGRMTWNFGGFRWMFKSLVNGMAHTDVRVREEPDLFTPETVKNYMGKNFAEFMIQVYQQILNYSD